MVGRWVLGGRSVVDDKFFPTEAILIFVMALRALIFVFRVVLLLAMALRRMTRILTIWVGLVFLVMVFISAVIALLSPFDAKLLTQDLLDILLTTRRGIVTLQ